MYGSDVRLVFAQFVNISMRPFHQISSILDEKRLLARFWQAASQFWQTERAWVAALAVFLIVVVLLQLLVQVALNL